MSCCWIYVKQKLNQSHKYNTYYIRSSSHSHSQNTSTKFINQLCNYEKILIETIERIADKKAQEYKSDIRQHSARLEFGNAVDTKDAKLIKIYYKKLRNNSCIILHDRMLYIKYTNPIIRKIINRIGKKYVFFFL